MSKRSLHKHLTGSFNSSSGKKSLLGSFHISQQDKDLLLKEILVSNFESDKIRQIQPVHPLNLSYGQMLEGGVNKVFEYKAGKPSAY